MALSGVTTFDSTAREIIEDALRDLGVIREDEPVADGDAASAIRKMNRMIKTWQAKGVHLWTKKTAIIFLQKDQRVYTLNSSSTDHATLDYSQTTLDGNYLTGDNVIFTEPVEDVLVGDFIGIVLDDNSLFWTTVKLVYSTIKIKITDVFSSAASDGNNVYIYSTKLDQPFNIFSGARKSDSEIDVPMFNMSYEEYFNLPNKTSSGTAVNYQYDRQRDSAIIKVWPIPANVNYRMEITFAEKIDDIVAANNTYDFPQEWLEALELNLAVRLGPGYGVAKSQDFQELKLQAQQALIDAMTLDAEQGSIYLQADEESADYA